MAQAMEIGVTAEGVETLQTAEILRDLGCNVLQGYVFAKPAAPGDLIHLMNSAAAQTSTATPHYTAFSSLAA